VLTLSDSQKAIWLVGNERGDSMAKEGAGTGPGDRSRKEGLDSCTILHGEADHHREVDQKR